MVAVVETRSMYGVNGGVINASSTPGLAGKPTVNTGVFTVLALVACLLPGLAEGEVLDQAAGGLQPLSAQQMAAISGGDMVSLPITDSGRAPQGLSLEVLEVVAKTLVPGLMVLDSDTSVSGIHFPEDAAIQIRHDGALMLPLPIRIEQIRMENLRIGGGSSMGTITMHNVQFHPQSRLAITIR